MWTDIKPKERRFIGFSEALEGKLVEEGSDFDINIGMLQNNYVQKLYKRFKHTTLIPDFYNIFYTIMINQEVWDGLTDFQKHGIEKAIHEGQMASVAYQSDTTFWAISRNQSMGVNFHFLSIEERNEWKNEFYPKMVKSIVENSEKQEETEEMIKKIEALIDDLKFNHEEQDKPQ
ncbi:hypothetical protein KW060_10565 [Pseudemcibacter aquimaris]|nr:hypothetical protein KW060_10565 [Pseudemcibacter aquimaris]